MIVLTSLEELSCLKAPIHLALGTFDGLHLGHQALILSAKTAAKKDPSSLCAVLSFSNTPRSYFLKEKQPALCSFEEKKAVLDALGVDVFLSLPFGEKLAKLSAKEFLLALQTSSPCGIRSLSVGKDWHFGNNREGHVPWLNAHKTDFGFELFVTPDILCPQGQRVSSTRLRKALLEGELPLFSELLGRPYCLQGRVCHGQALARELGAPTANLKLPSPLPLLPPLGVYVGKVRKEEENVAKVSEKVSQKNKADDKKGLCSPLTSSSSPSPTFWAVGNLGKRPTLTIPDPKPTLEVHLLDFEGDLYGELLSFEFCHFLRTEKKFASLEELKKQIAQDIEEAKKYTASL